jgi:flavin-binding protein dodecin
MDTSVVAARSYTGTIRRKFAASAADERPATIEFVGASDDTIAEAVRRALARASQSLRTLEGVGVLVIPQVYRDGPNPRYRVTLQITAPEADAAQASGPPSPTR